MFIIRFFFKVFKRILGLPFYILTLIVELLHELSPFILLLGIIVILLSGKDTIQAIREGHIQRIRTITEVYLPMLFMGVITKYLFRLFDSLVNVLWRDGDFSYNHFADAGL